MQEEMESLDRELDFLAAEEQRIGQPQPSNGEGLDGPENVPAGETEPPTEEQDSGADIHGESVYTQENKGILIIIHNLGKRAGANSKPRTEFQGKAEDSRDNVLL